MPADETGSERIIVGSDEDWKDRVKAEDAALDEKLKGESGPAAASKTEPADSSSMGPMPPPTFSTLVSMFATQAMVALGFIPNPVTGKAEPQLEVARHFIDMLEVLEEKTRRNLTGNEANLLETSLHQLRMAYIELSKTDGTSS